MKKILVTGGAGFIGSHLVRYFTTKYPEYKIINIDSLTYAANQSNIKDLNNYNNYKFIKADITDLVFIKNLFNEYKFDSVIHLAAESHVDRSILDPFAFAKTNIMGTLNLLDTFKNLHSNNWGNNIFYHVSTDEVYGSLSEKGLFSETTPYSPNSPYSASKASSDHFVRAYGETFDLPYIISNCSNNYGPNQYPEKLIPLMINNILQKKKLPVYGDGNYTRDWLHVFDHIKAIDLLFHKAQKNETYNIGGWNEWKNLDLIKLLCNIMDEKIGRNKGESSKLIEFIKDRPGHDKRYAIDSSKIFNETGWKASIDFKEGISHTVDWYLNNNYKS